MQAVIMPVSWVACFIAVAMEAGHYLERFLSLQRLLSRGD